MGQSSVITAPTLRAARNSSGWASHTSSRESRPFLNSLTTALRARRYSTRPPVPETGNPCKADGPKLIDTRVPSRRPLSLGNCVAVRGGLSAAFFVRLAGGRWAPVARPAPAARGGSVPPRSPPDRGPIAGPSHTGRGPVTARSRSEQPEARRAWLQGDLIW